MSWTQPICFDCWATTRANADGSVPVPTRITEVEPERCCICGRLTIEGIYIRMDPRAVPHPRKEPDENPNDQT